MASYYLYRQLSPLSLGPRYKLLEIVFITLSSASAAKGCKRRNPTPSATAISATMAIYSAYSATSRLLLTHARAFAMI